MKKKVICVGIILSLSIFSAGCGAGPESPVVFSNLTEESIRYDLDSLLQKQGVKDQKRNVFFQHVDQINGFLRKDQLTDGFTPLTEPAYDAYDLQDAWSEVYPDFLGYNCRITAFSLYEEAFRALPEPSQPLSRELLEFDMAALEEDGTAFPGSERKFLSFYTPVPTEASKDISLHAEKVRRAWEQRGIVFGENHGMTMINVFFHMQEGERNLLYVGHAGILLETPDRELWFLEKLSFQEPYQLVSMDSRKALQKYLMDKYDVDQGQPTAKPFILENDSLLENRR